MAEALSEKPLAVITGTSRGIGSVLAVKLAPHFDILGNHSDRSKQKEFSQLEVIRAVEKNGGSMRSITADITTDEGRKDLVIEALSTHRGRIVAVCLNAAGGMEEGKGEYYTSLINTKAQLELTHLFLPFLADGAAIIFETSNYAHCWLPDKVNGYRQFRQPPRYPVVAASKYETERLLLKEARTWERNIRLGVAVGQPVKSVRKKGTGAVVTLKRYDPDRLKALESYSAGGVLPTAEEYADAIVDLILNQYPSGHTVFVGGEDGEPVDKKTAYNAYRLNRARIARLLPMYSPEKLMVDKFISPRGSKLFGTAIHQVKPHEVGGHFSGRYGDFQVVRGVDLSEMGAQAIALTLLSVEPHPDGEFMAILEEHKSFFDKFVYRYEVVRAKAEITGLNAKGVLGRCKFFVPLKNGKEEQVGEMTGVRLSILLNMEIAERFYKNQQAARAIPDSLVY